MTRVLIDRRAGFCAGVQRAIQGARDARRLQGGRVSVYGELVHNPEVMARLEREGIGVVRDIEEPREGEHVILRAHGVPPAEEQRLRERGVHVHDFTCPRVRGVHRLIDRGREAGVTVLIVGSPRHPEVRGHLGRAGVSGRALASLQDAESVPLDGRTLVLAQTTVSPELFREVVGLLRRRVESSGGAAELEVADTICPFVLRRQEWIRRASRAAGASLVIGGRDSSNTRRLVEIASANGPVFWIEGPEELELPKVLLHPKVALTAGASTPRETIREVLGRLEAAGAVLEEA